MGKKSPADEMYQAYAAAAAVAREALREDDPEGAALLEAASAADIVVVPGTYDHVEQVLDLLSLAYTLVPGHELHRASLRPGQLIVVNCPGYGLDRTDVAALREVVGAGATLFTTDWALRHVVEQAFPGYLAWNELQTGDEVVGVEVAAPDNPWLHGVMAEGDEPRWWLEGSSYPIRVLRPEAVQVLMTSAELGAAYQEPAVAVGFGFGDGEVFHMISHYYLQRAELRSARQQATGADTAAYFASKSSTAPTALQGLAMQDVPVGAAEAAYSSARLFTNITASARKRRKR
jgi:hypothetical protein